MMLLTRCQLKKNNNRLLIAMIGHIWVIKITKISIILTNKAHMKSRNPFTILSLEATVPYLRTVRSMTPIKHRSLT